LFEILTSIHEPNDTWFARQSRRPVASVLKAGAGMMHVDGQAASLKSIATRHKKRRKFGRQARALPRRQHA